MTPPVKPELQDPNNPNPTDTTSQIPPNPPTLPPDTNVDTTERGRQLFMAALAEKDNELNRTRFELEQLRTQAQTNNRNNNNQEDAWQNFTQAPREMIRQEVADTVAPLTNFIARFERQQQIDSLKMRYRTQPAFQPIFQYAESYIDQLLSGATQVDDRVMQVALNSVAGAIATGQLVIPGLNLNLNNQAPPTPPATTRNPIVPPSTPRSTPPVPEPQNQSNNAQDRELTESENRLRIHFKMTKEEFLKGMANNTMVVGTPNQARS